MLQYMRVRELREKARTFQESSQMHLQRAKGESGRVAANSILQCQVTRALSTLASIK